MVPTLSAFLAVAAILPILAGASPVQQSRGVRLGAAVPLFKRGTKPEHIFEAIEIDRARLKRKLDRGNKAYVKNALPEEERPIVNSFAARPVSFAVTPTNGSVELRDQYRSNIDVSYSGPVAVGTPGRTFDILFDTGSSDFWLPGPQSGTRHQIYNPQDSTTAEGSTQEWDVQYGTGENEGYLARDTVNVAGVEVTQQVFAVSNTSNPVFERATFDGLMGMAFGSLANSGYPTFFENAMNQTAVTAPYFSFYLQRARDTVPNTSGSIGGGEMCIGCLLTDKMTTEINWTPVSIASYWQVQMDGLQVNNQLVPGVAGEVIIDTGTTLIYLPAAAVAALFVPLGGVLIEGPYYAIPADTPSFNISLVFNGVGYNMELADIVLGFADSTRSRVVMGIIPDDTNRDPRGQLIGIIGDSFLKNVVSIYNYLVDFGTAGLLPAVGFTGVVDVANATHGDSIASIAAAVQSSSLITDLPSPTAGTTRPATRTGSRSVVFSDVPNATASGAATTSTGAATKSASAPTFGALFFGAVMAAVVL